MSKLYCKLWTCQFGWADSDLTSAEFVEVLLGKMPPTELHIINADGIWIIPNKTHADISAARKARYCAETDELKTMINKDSLMGEDVSELQAEFISKVNAIKKDLPFTKFPSHYQAIKHEQP